MIGSDEIAGPRELIAQVDDGVRDVTFEMVHDDPCVSTGGSRGDERSVNMYSLAAWSNQSHISPKP